MDNYKDQAVENKSTTLSSRQERMQDRLSLTGRPNIDVITKRNEEEIRQDRNSLYKKIGTAALLVIVIIAVTYFFS